MNIALRLKLIYIQILSFWKERKLKKKEDTILAEMRAGNSLFAMRGNCLMYDAETIRNLPVDEKARLGAKIPGLLQHLALHDRRLGFIALTRKN